MHTCRTSHRRPAPSPTALLVSACLLSASIAAPNAAPAAENFLEPVDVERDSVAGAEGLVGARGVAVSPDGVHVYVAARGDDSVALFSRDPVTGQLGFVASVADGLGGVDGLAGAHAITVSPDGSHVYVASIGENAVVSFTREESTGVLTFIEAEFDGSGGVDGLSGARAIAASPDGAHVYVASQNDDAVAVFARDAIGGGLTFVESRINGDGGVTGINAASGVAVSPDGAHVYVAGEASDAVAVFARNAASGSLAFVEAIFDFDGASGAEGLNRVRGVTVTPDGAHVYAVSQGDDAIVAFARDAVTGMLTHVGTEIDDDGTNDGLGGAREVTSSPDGRYVFVSSAADDAVAAFERDPVSGLLSIVDFEFDDEAGVDGLGGARSVAVSPEGASVYVASQTEDAVAAFRFIACAAEPLPVCRGAGTASTVIVDSKDDLRDRLRFGLQRGDEVLPAALGDPVNGLTSYNLCIYDSISGTPATVMGSLAPLRGSCGEGPCWVEAGRTRISLRYQDRDLTPDGVERLVLKSGEQGRSVVRLDAEGSALKFGSAVPLPLYPPITVQLVNSLGECWGVVYLEEDIRRNDGPIQGPQRFKARGGN